MRDTDLMQLALGLVPPWQVKACAFDADKRRSALAKAGVQGMTVSEVRGFGRQKGHREIYRGAECEIEYVPKIKLEVAVPADLAQRVIDTIRNAAHTGNIGDGKIFVLALEAVQRGTDRRNGRERLVEIAAAASRKSRDGSFLLPRKSWDRSARWSGRCGAAGTPLADYTPRRRCACTKLSPAQVERDEGDPL
jgi:nitrogen regulatory protein PII